MGIIRRITIKKELGIVFGIVLAVFFVSLCIISEDTFAEAYINLTASGDVNIEAVKGANPSLSVGKSVVSVDTNAAYGYSLYISAPSEETNGFSPLTLTSDNTVKLLGLNSTTPVAFSSSSDYVNMWGFAVPGDNLSSGSTISSFSPSASYESLIGSGGTIDTATISSLTWQGVKNDDQKIYDSSDDTNVSLPIYYGVFINDTASSGTYTNVVSYTAVVESPPAIADGMYMQEITQEMCENTPTGIKYDVIDARDEKHYFITHYNNDVGGEYEINECWMVQNLDLDLVVKNTNTDTVAAAGAGIDGGEGIVMGTTDTNGDFVALTTDNTDLPTDSPNTSVVDGMWQIPSGSKGYTTQTSTGVAWDAYGRNGSNNSSYEVRSYNPGDKCFTMPSYANRGNSDTIATGSANGCKPTTEEANSKHGGKSYNYPAATAGTRTAGDGGGEAPGSICPKGWRLPYGGKPGVSADNFVYHSDHSYYNLFNAISNGAYPAGTTVGTPVRVMWNDSLSEIRWNGIKNEPGDNPIGFAGVRVGYYYSTGSFFGHGTCGYGRSSTATYTGAAYSFQIGTGNIYPGTGDNFLYAGQGLQIRCVLR